MAEGDVFCSWSLANWLIHPIGFLHMASLSWWGPRAGRPTRQVGRPHNGPTDLPFWSMGSFLGPLVIGTGIGSCTVGFLLWWAIYSIFWHVSCPDLLECYVLDQTTPLYYKISWKSPAHILEHHLWNQLVNKSILAFIPHFSPFLCRSWWSKLVINDRQQDPPHLALCSSRVKVRTDVKR